MGTWSSPESEFHAGPRLPSTHISAPAPGHGQPSAPGGETGRQRSGERAQRVGGRTVSTRCPSNSQGRKWQWEGGGEGMGKGSGDRDGGWERGRGGDAMGPAVQLRATHPFEPHWTKGQTGGCPLEKEPRGLGSPRSGPDPEPSRAARTYLPAASRPAPAACRVLKAPRVGPGRGGGSRGKRAGGGTFASSPPPGAGRGGRRSELRELALRSIEFFHRAWNEVPICSGHILRLVTPPPYIFVSKSVPDYSN